MVVSIGHYVDNKLVAGKSGRTGDITNPATGEMVIVTKSLVGSTVYRFPTPLAAGAAPEEA